MSPTPYYQDDLVTLYHGTWENVLPTLPPADLIFTSPPYNLGSSSGGGFGHYAADARMGSRGGGGKWHGGSLSEGYEDHDDAMPQDEYEDWQRAFLATCWTQLSDAGAIFYNHKPRVQAGNLWTPLNVNPGLPVRQIITWARAGGMNFAPTHYVPTYEWIVVFAKPAWRLKSKGASGVGDLWRVPQQPSKHPAPFPLDLPARAIESAGPSLVIDPHAGSGTTLRAAKDAGVRAIGIEKSAAYCSMAAARLGSWQHAVDHDGALPFPPSPVGVQ